MRWTDSPRVETRRRGRWSGLPSLPILLRWLYVARLGVATGLYLATVLRLSRVAPVSLVVASVGLVLALVFSGASAWHTHVRRRPAGTTFLYLQTLFDLALVTAVVHVSGGPRSDFFPLYIPVIALAAVMVPIRGTVLVSVLAGVLYFADIFWGHLGGNLEGMLPTVWLQLGVFAVVAGVTAYLGSRVRVVGEEKAVLERELSRVQLEAGDILRHIRSGVLTVDGAGRLLFANAAAEQLLGLSFGEWFGRPVMDQIARISPEFWAAIQQTAKNGMRLVRHEATVRLSDRTFPIGLTTTILEGGAEGVSPGVTAIFTEISDQKRIEELRLRAERLEAVAALSASLAHEIKNPLASIRSSVEQLSRGRGGTEDEALLGQLIVRESDRLTRLLSEFLDFSRVQVTRLGPVDLKRVADAAVRLVRAHPDCAADATLEVKGAACVIEGDEDLLHRIVLNLVLNAVQAGGEALHVTVRVGEARRDDLPEGVAFEHPVALVVSDNGPGISEDLRARLFEPFVTRRAGGTGLGLATVQRAVEAHRGLLFVESTLGRGTTFTIVLPAVAGTQGQP